MDKLFQGLFSGELANVISVTDFLLCISVSLALGLLMAVVCAWKDRHSKSFVITMGLLPAVVCVVIMMVNGNIGAGVAVAGAFSLVRFRSAPGSAKEIVSIFLAMGAGLICGMGYLGFAALFTVILCGVFLLYNLWASCNQKSEAIYKTVKITIPEDLDYTGAFDDIFVQYTKAYTLSQIKTTNMGSMFRLTYEITLLDTSKEKEMIDQIRTRNGNLEIMVSRQERPVAEL